MKKTINIFLFIIPLCVCFYVFICNSFNKYNYLFLLPLVFLFCYQIFLKKFLFEKFSFFRISFITVLFLRYVVLPFLIVFANYDNIVSSYKPSISQTNFAILLMIYELVVYSIFIWFIPKIKKNNNKNKKLMNNINYKNVIFVLFCIIAILLLFLTPSVIHYYNFISVSESLNSLTFSTMEEITILFTTCAKGLIFLMLLDRFSTIYKKHNNKIYYYLGLIITIINSCIYYGSNRSTFIFIAIASFATFYSFYRKGLKQMVIILCSIVFVILPIITAYRNYYDYYSQFSGIERTLISSQGKINEYFGGINNVAVGIETSNVFPEKRNLLNLAFDFARPIIGLNIFLKNLNMDYSNLYFNYCYHQSNLVSVIFPTISQGYFYFGFIGAPLLGLFLIILALKLEKYCLDLTNPFYIYFFTPSLLRLGTLTGPNINIQMNDLSLKILAPLLLVLLYKILVKKQNGVNYET